MKFWNAVLFLLAPLVVASIYAPGAVTAESSCETTLVDGDGRSIYFDLDQLHHPAGEVDKLLLSPSPGVTYYTNFCERTDAACATPSGVCLEMEDDHYSMGKLSTFETSIIDLPHVSQDHGLMVSFSDGDLCGTGTAVPHRFSTIYIICKSGANPGYYYTADLDKFHCNVTLYMYSEAGCGVKGPHKNGGGMGAGWIIFIILLVAVVLYVCCGALINWKFFGGDSMATIFPNYMFWTALPTLVLEGIKFIFSCGKRPGQSSYV